MAFEDSTYCLGFINTRHSETDILSISTSPVGLVRYLAITTGSYVDATMPQTQCEKTRDTALQPLREEAKHFSHACVQKYLGMGMHACALSLQGEKTMYVCEVKGLTCSGPVVHIRKARYIYVRALAPRTATG